MVTLGGGVLSVLTTLSILIILGLLITILSKKIKTSNVLLLILAGIIIGFISRKLNILPISQATLVTLAIMALVLIVFYGASRFQIKALDKFSTSALRLTFFSVFLNMIIIGILFTYLVFGKLTVINILYSLIFAIIVSGTDPASTFSLLKSKAQKTIEFLKVEAILNTPIVVLIPFILLDIINQVVNNVVVSWQSYLVGILTQILVGIGSGIFIGMIFFRSMRKFYSEEISPLAVITAALISYILAENLYGNGVLAVAVLGFVFGNMYVSHKDVLQEFSGMLSNALEILVFILLGYMITLNFNWIIYVNSITIFVALILIRYLSIRITLRNENYTPKEYWFLALNLSKGIAVAVLVFSLAILGTSEISMINKYAVLVMIYSLVLGTIVNRIYMTSSSGSAKPTIKKKQKS